MYGLLLLLHILGATIWTGGHIIVSLVVLPRALRQSAPEVLLDFESMFEKIGMPALAVQIITGPILAYRFLPDVGQWFDMSNPLARPIAAKLILLALTAAVAFHAKLRVIPVLSKDKLGVMAWHVIAVTTFAILFVAVGVSFRTGWLY